MVFRLQRASMRHSNAQPHPDAFKAASKPGLRVSDSDLQAFLAMTARYDDPTPWFIEIADLEALLTWVRVLGEEVIIGKDGHTLEIYDTGTDKARGLA